jgi:hypothetical protein
VYVATSVPLMAANVVSPSGVEREGISATGPSPPRVRPRLALDRLVFGENGHNGGGRATPDAVQRLQNGCRDDEGASEKSR